MQICDMHRGRLIRGVRGEMHLSRAAVSLGDNNVKIDIMAFGVPPDCSSRRFLQHANSKSRSATSLFLAHWQRRELHCPALSNCCRFFQLAARGCRTSLCSSIAGLSRKEFPVMTDRRRHLFTRTDCSFSRRRFLATSAAIAGGLGAASLIGSSGARAATLKTVRFSEAVHNLGYINLYVGMHA